MAPIAERQPYGLESVARTFVDRPWLSLYGRRIRAVHPVGSVSAGLPPWEPSLLHRVMPDELLLLVLEHLPPVALGRAACVCRRWRYTTLNPLLWSQACRRAWQACSEEETLHLLQFNYDGSWRKMWRMRPRLRLDGIYVSRNTYIKRGIVEWHNRNPVHIVCYYRYLRFLPSGKFFYKVSPQVLREVAKYFSGKASAAKAEGALVGRGTLTEDRWEGAILYPGARPTVLRMRGRLRGTCEGANNRLDLLSLHTCGMDEAEVPHDTEDVLGAVQGWGDDETHHADVPAVSHTRGMAPFVFVPFYEVDTDVVNLPVDKMDFYLPG
eukprot:TRINITY_DN9662_c0_g1_i1.p1 TRINITY_DN9662_c0_g1~~TRINITY_DN9662_c0_g1_i1.p1  ORF type:complete len:324 (+),score=51.67 TRINITY_DN9662_c0_g1_i1:660-1631(+)